MILFASLVVLLLCLSVGLVTVTVNRTVQGLVSANQQVTISDDNGVIANPTVLAAQPATLTTHTTNTTGTLTMTNSSHGIITGQRIDIFWTGGQCYGAVAGTVSGTTVPIASVSGGSNLPSSSTPVTIGIPVSAPFPVTGDNIKALICSGQQQGYFVFNDGADLVAILIVAGGVSVWAYGDPAANPLAGDVPTVVFISHSYVTGSVTNMQATAVVH